MNLTSQLTALRDEPRGLTRVQRATHCCDLAKQLEKAGEYEAAREALGEFWPERDGSPVLDQLDEATKAQVVLRVGALSGWLGSADQAARCQETAKDLITRSLEIFDVLGRTKEPPQPPPALPLFY